MTIERIKCGNGNCHIIIGENGSVLVDTARTKYREIILEKCKANNVKLIVLTHGHVDHVQNAAYLSKELNVPIAMNKADYELTKNNMLEPLFAHSILGKIILSLSMESLKKDIIEPFEPTVFLKEGISLSEYGVDAEVIEIPGHTKGSIGIKVGNTDFLVGDALMNMFYPTKSLLYCDRKQVDSSADKISSFGKMKIHFGHGNSVDNRKKW